MYSMITLIYKEIIMKFFKAIPLLLPIMLTACADSSIPENTTIPEESQSVTEKTTPLVSTESTVSTSNENNSAESGYVGICGETFDPASFEERPDYVLNEYLYYRTDYGYTELFDGKIYNSYDNPDKFNLDEWQCTDQCTASSEGYFMINKGDKLGKLICTDAYAEYFLNTKYASGDSFGLMSSAVSFEGEIEVTGYVDRFDGNEGYVEEGDLFFYPDDESWQGLPIPFRDYDCLTFCLKDERLMYSPFRLSLGSVYDYSELDLESIIPQGSTAHVRCILKDLQFKYSNSNFGGFEISSATVASAEIIY